MSDSSENNPVTHCSFCQSTHDEVAFLVTGDKRNGAAICNRCIQYSHDRFLRNMPIGRGKRSDFESDAEHDPSNIEQLYPHTNLPTPSQLKSHLDDYVIGQENAKKLLSVAVYNHYKRLWFNRRGSFAKDGKQRKRKPRSNNVEINKSNVLLLGPTGSGKTLLAQVLAKKLNVPFAIADATTITETGYVGDDVESILHRLLLNCNGNIEEAEMGIVYLDELDKISRKSENLSITRDVSGEGVQQALLKLIEGSLVTVPPQGGRKHPHKDNIKLDTGNILFICGGAFEGLEKIIERRVATSTSIGFSAEVRDREYSRHQHSELLEQAEPDDLMRYGLIPELVGRLPVTVSLQALDENALVRILSEPKNALIKQYKAMFAMEKVKIEFNPEALRAIARKAIDQGTGARGLRTVMETVLIDLMYHLPDCHGKYERIEISAAVVENKAAPTYIKAGARNKASDFGELQINRTAEADTGS